MQKMHIFACNERENMQNKHCRPAFPINMGMAQAKNPPGVSSNELKLQILP